MSPDEEQSRDCKHESVQSPERGKRNEEGHRPAHESEHPIGERLEGCDTTRLRNGYLSPLLGGFGPDRFR